MSPRMTGVMAPIVDRVRGLTRVPNHQLPQSHRLRPPRPPLYSITVVANRRRLPRPFLCRPFRIRNIPAVAVPRRVHLSLVPLSLIRKIPRRFRLLPLEQRLLLRRCISNRWRRRSLSIPPSITQPRSTQVRLWSPKKWKQFPNVIHR